MMLRCMLLRRLPVRHVCMVQHLDKPLQGVNCHQAHVAAGTSAWEEAHACGAHSSNSSDMVLFLLGPTL
jgi:hypothetical protein